MKKISVLSVCFALVLLAGCTQAPTAQDVNTAPGAGTETKKEKINIGVIAPLSGPAATYGEDVSHGLKYVAKTINEAGGIDGQEINLIFEDGKCNGKDATTAVQKLINVDGVQAIAGGACSSETIPSGKIAQEAGVVMLSPTASSPEVSSIGDYVFRYWNDADAGVVMLDYIESNDGASIALMYENTDYAAAYANVIESGFAGDIVLTEKFNSDEKDFSILAKKVVDNLGDIDYLVYIPQSEANVIPFVKALQDEGVWDEVKGKFIGTETVMTATTIEALGEDAEGMVGVRFPELAKFGDAAVEASEKVLAGYEAQSADIFVLFAADALSIIADAITEVGNDGEKIKDYIAGFTPENKRASLMGDFWFDAEGDGQGIPFAVVEIIDGEIMSIE